MEMFDTSMTNDKPKRTSVTSSNSTATVGPSVAEFITFAALSWSSVIVVTVVLLTVMWCWMKIIGEDDDDDEYGSIVIFKKKDTDKDKLDKLRWCCGTVFVTGVIAAVTGAVLLVVGSVLSTQNGDSTGLSTEGIAGRVLLILTEVITLLVWALLVAAFVFLCCAGEKCGNACIAICGIVSGTLFVIGVIGVALLGWSSFEFDTIQGNGSNSTVTPGLRIAGVVFSSVGVGVNVGILILLLILISCGLYFLLFGDCGCLSRAKKWLTDCGCLSRAKEWLTDCGCLSRAKEWLTDCGCLSRAKEWLTEAWENRKVTKEAEARQKLLESRQKEAKSLLEEALKRGFEECRTVVCLLVGVAGAGKTHTKHLLFRWAPPELRNSTPLAVRPVQAIRVRASSQSGRLQEVDPDELDKILASTVASGVPMDRKNSLQNLCCIGMQKKTESTGISPPSYSHGNPARETPSYGIGKKWNSENKRIDSLSINPHYQPKKRSCCCCNCFGFDSELQQSTKVALKETAHQIAHTTQPQQHMNCDWIYLIDSGGQNEFLEVMPAFLQHTSVCLFVMKLSEMLSECPKIEYFENGKPIGKPVVCPFTNEQMLMRCVQTIQTQCTHQDSSSNQESKLVMVGTHKDCARWCKESIKEKNRILHNKLCPEFDKSLIFHGENMRELVFPINAKIPGSQDYKVANKITEKIFNVVSSLKPRKTPISWFKFEQVIQKLCRTNGKRIMRWKECLQVARSLHLSKKDLNAALDHLANFGVIHYYWHLLPDIVFVDPQFLLDKISELVKYHYQLRHDPQPNTTMGGNLREFRNEGCITLELLEQFPEHYTDFFTAADFLKLINDRLIVTQHISSGKYFMPCLLRTMKSEEVDQYRVTASGVAPLAIHFSSGWVPHGVFCSLVAFLRSSQNSSPWKLYPRPNDRSAPLCLTRNCIKFQFPEDAPGSLTLIDAFSHFEVYVDAPYDVCARSCLSIQQTLFRGIQKAAKTFQYKQLVPKLAFLCKHDNNQPHLALPGAALDYWTCQYEPDTVYDRLMNEHMVWHPDKGVPTEEMPTAESSLWSRITTSLCQKVQRVKTTKEDVHFPLELHSEVDEEPTQAAQHNLAGAKVCPKLSSPEYQTFQSYFAVLCNGISDPGWLASELYSRDMISRDKRQEAELQALSASVRTRRLLSAVEDQILTSPKPKFADLLYILHSEPSLEHLATKLEETYRHEEDLQLPLRTHSEVDGGVLMGEAQPKALSQTHTGEAPNEEVHLQLETHSEVDGGMQASPSGMQAPLAEVHIVLEVPSEVEEDIPTVLECTRFRGRKRTINIPREIGTNYYYFGLHLLDDPNRTRVHKLELEYRQNAERINTEILREWATGRGKKPVNWKILIEVLHDIELGALASEIEDVKKL